MDKTFRTVRTKNAFLAACIKGRVVGAHISVSVFVCLPILYIVCPRSTKWTRLIEHTVYQKFLSRSLYKRTGGGSPGLSWLATIVALREADTMLKPYIYIYIPSVYTYILQPSYILNIQKSVKSEYKCQVQLMLN